MRIIKFLIIFLIIFLLKANLQAASFMSIPYTFSPRTLIRSAQIMANYNSLRNAIVDGTKKIDVAQLYINSNLLIDNDLDITAKDITLTGNGLIAGTLSVTGNITTITNVQQENQILLSRNSSNLATAIAVATANSGTTYTMILDRDITLAAAATMPTNVSTFKVIPGSIITMGNFSITYANQFIDAADNIQIWSLSGTGLPTGNITNREIYPTWTGAGLADADDTYETQAAQQLAKNSRARIVFTPLPDGADYFFSDEDNDGVALYTDVSMYGPGGVVSFSLIFDEANYRAIQVGQGASSSPPSTINIASDPDNVVIEGLLFAVETASPSDAPMLLYTCSSVKFRGNRARYFGSATNEVIEIDLAAVGGWAFAGGFSISDNNFERCFNGSAKAVIHLNGASKGWEIQNNFFQGQASVISSSYGLSFDALTTGGSVEGNSIEQFDFGIVNAAANGKPFIAGNRMESIGTTLITTSRPLSILSNTYSGTSPTKAYVISVSGTSIKASAGSLYLDAQPSSNLSLDYQTPQADLTVSYNATKQLGNLRVLDDLGDYNFAYNMTADDAKPSLNASLAQVPLDFDIEMEDAFQFIKHVYAGQIDDATTINIVSLEAVQQLPLFARVLLCYRELGGADAVALYEFYVISQPRNFTPPIPWALSTPVELALIGSSPIVSANITLESATGTKNAVLLNNDTGNAGFIDVYVESFEHWE